ncbi:fimbrillin family protein [Parabacteroides sp. HGS0025]|uniref:fimbrillin family protein n=1 Tax=Parabacteroides sp. HGS0025 TaxID=1078087 RepID=UPI000695C920|nr:fimbrillin family protein [Parabacteroides sp. HGS0025]
MTEGYKTTFSDGNAIGLFAIKNGAIVDNIDNMRLTYTVAEDGTTRWSLPIDSKIYYYEGVTYIAYPPYKERITIDPLQATNEIVSSLVNNEHLQPAADQSDAANYAASDLMIAASVANATDIEKVTLTLNFKHQFSLLVMTPIIYTTSIYPPEDAGFTYCAVSKAGGVDSLQIRNIRQLSLPLPTGSRRFL